MFAEIAQDQQVKSLEFQSQSYITNASTGKSTLGTYATVATIKGLLWNTAQSNPYYSGKFKEDTIALCLLETLTGVEDSQRVKDGSDYYEVNYINNVAAQDQAYFIELKKWVK